MPPASVVSGANKRIGVVDGLRGWAALAVVAAHAYFLPFREQWYVPVSVGFGYHLSPIGALSNLNHAVTLFFVLSGFVLTLPYVSGTRSMETGADVWSFIKRRAHRLLPLYFFGFIFIAALTRYDAHPRESLWNLLMMSTLSLHFFHPLSPTPYNGVLWSLEVEWWCSMLLPFLLLHVRKWSIASMALTSIAIALLCRLLLTYHLTTINTAAFMSVNNIPTRIDSFVLGMAAAFLFSKHKEVVQRKKMTLLLVGMFYLVAGFELVEIMMQYELPILIASIACLLITLGWTLLFLGLLVSDGFLVRIVFLSVPIRLIGRMCYSIYVWHNPMIDALMPMANIFRFIRYVSMLSVVSWLSYRYIEHGRVPRWRDLVPAKNHQGPTADTATK